MSLDDFLQENREAGILDSQGNFTLDLSKASEKLSASALPSDYHFILKFVQLANRLRAPEIHLKIYVNSLTLSFDTDRLDSEVFSLPTVAQALREPLKDWPAEVRDLVNGLLGSFSKENNKIRWITRSTHREQTISIGKDRLVKSSQQQLNSQDRRSCELQIEHPRRWKFWLDAPRRANYASLVTENCSFSAAKIFVDGLELEASSSSALLRTFQSVEQPLGGALAAWNTLFVLAGDGEHSAALRRPSLGNYLVRKDVANIWAQGSRVHNSLWPDGKINSSWLLQFVRDGENLSMRHIHKREAFRAVLAINSLKPEPEERGRVIVVRQGVKIHDAPLKYAEDEFEPFRGCTLLWVDDELDTDLTGFQLIQNDEFKEKILTFGHLVENAHQFFEEHRDLVVIPDRRPNQTRLQGHLKRLRDSLSEDS